MKRYKLLAALPIIAGVLVLHTGKAVLAAPPPPPPPVPTGDVFAQIAAGGGIAAFGAYRLWKAKRAVKRVEHE